MVKFCPVLLTYDFCWPEGNQYTVKPTEEFSLVFWFLRPCESQSLVGSSSLQAFPKLSSSSALNFQDTAHVPHLYLSGSCWYCPGCPHQQAHQKPRPEERDEQQPLQRDGDPCDSCFPWGQRAVNTRDGSPVSCPESWSSCTPSWAALHLCGSSGLQQLPSHTHKPRWVVCPSLLWNPAWVLA